MSLERAQSLVSAHRGGSEWAKPQTMAQFRAAAEHGVRDLEFDIRFSADSVALVSHNETNACAPAGIQRTAAAVVQRCGNFELGELLALAKAYPSVTLRAELKPFKGQSAASQRAEAKRLAGAFKAAGLVDRTVLASFNYKTVTGAFKSVDRRLHVQALERSPEPRTVRAAAKAGADEYSYNASLGGSKWINAFIKRQGMTPTVWFLGESKQPVSTYAVQVALGASKVITDKPTLAVQKIRTSTCKSRWINVKNTDVFKGTLKPSKRAYPVLVGPGKKVKSQKNLDGVTLRVFVASKAKGGSVKIGPRNSTLAHDTSVVSLKGKSSYEAISNPGDYGALRVYTTHKQPVSVRIQVTGYSVIECH